jgi:hypothetical protein
MSSDVTVISLKAVVDFGFGIMSSLKRKVIWKKSYSDLHSEIVSKLTSIQKEYFGDSFDIFVKDNGEELLLDDDTMATFLDINAETEIIIRRENYSK